MTKKQFLDAMNNIDDKFINELIDVPGEPRGNHFANKQQENYFVDEQPQKVYSTDNPIPFWKIAASTAAVVCFLTAGIFSAAALRDTRHIMPNDSATDNSSDIQSETSSKPDKFDTMLTAGIDFTIQSPDWTYHSDMVEKNDDENYAVVYVECRNISEENPLFIAVQRYRNGNPVYIGTLYVTDNSARTYRIDYNEEVKRGDELFLYISVKTDEIFRADGKWLP